MSTPPPTYSATAQESALEERKEDGTKVTEATDGAQKEGETTEAPATAEQVPDSIESVEESNPEPTGEDGKDKKIEDSPAQKSKSESPDAEGPSQRDNESQSPSQSPSDRDESAEPGEIDESAAPPLPNEPLPDQTYNGESSSSAPPLPAEPAPEPEDDGWEYHWNPNDSSYWFYNRFTGVWQKENPRLPTGAAASAPAVVAPVVVPPDVEPTAISNPISVAGGYNPAIHGDYDENAWYAVNARAAAEAAAAATNPLTGLDPTAAGTELASAGYFNRATGQWQAPDQNVERHSDEAKSRRQLNAYFDVDAAANMHDGRSLKAERSGKKPSRAELKAFKEKRRAKKEEKRRAWLRD
ncbi:hypothetical protein B0T20DRAFT_426895 [Sordaria brevicollis]|uniref:WW domain-containing protein n=1 Tax=Sordaria brevicollis TaxID=83679 RepID=A0AAE0NV22_SORBR|nr:hypothetical protein B0T20DRAFT_426895 [Sordaria brevicollis]